MLLKIPNSPGRITQKFPCLMKKTGIRIQKRQACDDFIENFRKKLKITLENSPEPTPQSSALILYKEPIPPMPELPAEVLDKLKLKREICPLIENLILSKGHLSVKDIDIFYKLDTEVTEEIEIEVEAEAEAEMELD